MSRTPGAKDKKPRRMVNAFPRKHGEAVYSVVVRLYGPYSRKSDMLWFKERGMDERLSVIRRVRREIEG